MERTAMSSAGEGVREKPAPAPTIGRSLPIGATLVRGGVNFSLFSRSAERIELLFFDRVEDARPSRVIPIDPFANRPIIIGTYSHLARRLARSTDFGPTGRSSQGGV